MRKSEFDGLIVKIVKTIEYTDSPIILIMGSQSAWASLDEFHDDDTQLAASREIDVSSVYHAQALPGANTVLDLMESIYGELSSEAEKTGIYIETMDARVATVPVGWEHRLVHYTAFSDDGSAEVLCLSIHDVCIAKAMRGEEKDRQYITELNNLGFVDVDAMLSLLDKGIDTTHTEYSQDFLDARVPAARSFLESLR